MKTVNALNIYLSDKRKHLLIILNIILVIFIILEVLVFKELSDLVSAEEGQAKRDQLCREGKLGSYCYKRR
tara:strand:+ start:224 stop:436 length:213 start_codon:yes stop_codon:yes gene_type:complete